MMILVIVVWIFLNLDCLVDGLNWHLDGLGDISWLVSDNLFDDFLDNWSLMVFQWFTMNMCDESIVVISGVFNGSKIAISIVQLV